MIIVPDANVLVYALFAPPEGGDGPRVERSRLHHQLAVDALRGERVLLPPLWRTEFLSGALRTFRRGAGRVEMLAEVYETAIRTFGPYEVRPRGRLVLELADKYDLTAQDATYYATARERGLVV